MGRMYSHLHRKQFMKIVQFALAALALTSLAACGGGSASDPTPQGSISGTVTKGPVGNATVIAYGISNGRMGSQLATASTDANGNFTLPIGAYAGPVMLQVSGGIYTDEASGISMPIAPGDVMTAAMPSITAGMVSSGVQVTSVTAMAQAMADHLAGGMTDANIANANTAVGNYFSVADILHIRPMNPLAKGSGAAANQDERNYGITLAAMSQYAQAQGMAFSSAMTTALMTDAEDGIMDGRNSAGQISMSMGGMMGGRMMPPTAGTSGLATAMIDFMNAARNLSGVTEADMVALVQKLTSSTGHL